MFVAWLIATFVALFIVSTLNEGNHYETETLLFTLLSSVLILIIAFAIVRWKLK